MEFCCSAWAQQRPAEVVPETTRGAQLVPAAVPRARALQARQRPVQTIIRARLARGIEPAHRALVVPPKGPAEVWAKAAGCPASIRASELRWTETPAHQRRALQARAAASTPAGSALVKPVPSFAPASTAPTAASTRAISDKAVAASAEAAGAAASAEAAGAAASAEAARVVASVKAARAVVPVKAAPARAAAQVRAARVRVAAAERARALRAAAGARARAALEGAAAVKRRARRVRADRGVRSDDSSRSPLARASCAAAHGG